MTHHKWLSARQFSVEDWFDVPDFLLFAFYAIATRDFLLVLKWGSRTSYIVLASHVIKQVVTTITYEYIVLLVRC